MFLLNTLETLHYNIFEGQHIDNLADILAYYIYIILGFDYDSFS